MVRNLFQFTILEERATPAALFGPMESLPVPRIEIVMVAPAHIVPYAGPTVESSVQIMRTDVFGGGGAADESAQEDVLTHWLIGEGSAEEVITVPEVETAEPEVGVPEPTAILLDPSSVVFVAEAAESPGE